MIYLLAAIVVIAGVFLGLLASYQKKLIYFPRPYGAGIVTRWDAEPGTTVLKYETQTGPQQAYLLSRSPQPRRLWFFCGGNGTVALDWHEWFQKNAPAEDAYLMFDMPGYGACAGEPGPDSIRDSIRKVIPAAAGSLGWTLAPADPRLRFFGHSLGAAVSLEAARMFDIHRGVLLTPFTSTMEMAKVRIGLPVGFLVMHRFDNIDRLRELRKRGGSEVFVIHGTDDESIPVTMSRKLAAEIPEVVRLTEIPGGHHNDLQITAKDTLLHAMSQARR
jgi:pimeloyl-ACP methyl ester carboxylesterase